MLFFEDFSIVDNSKGEEDEGGIERLLRFERIIWSFLFRCYFFKFRGVSIFMFYFGIESM